MLCLMRTSAVQRDRYGSNSRTDGEPDRAQHQPDFKSHRHTNDHRTHEQPDNG